MARQLRSGRKELPASEIDELSLQDEIHKPVHFIACASIPVEPVIVRRLARLPGLNGVVDRKSYFERELPRSTSTSIDVDFCSAEWKAERLKWLLYYNGLAVQVECRVWDERRDLALAKIVCVEILVEQCKGSVNPIFTCVSVAELLSTSSPIFCIGQPGADNLESVSPR
ncbi:hypothetical protein N7453_001608 [Penicillium expansum]|nr:hypothetical protein N7453_001608 [Penicillium expansum]